MGCCEHAVDLRYGGQSESLAGASLYPYTRGNAISCISLYSIDRRCVQSDRIWRLDLQDDFESCHPVDLRMILKSHIWL